MAAYTPCKGVAAVERLRYLRLTGRQKALIWLTFIFTLLLGLTVAAVLHMKPIVVPPVFGKTPALMGAATPCPNNGGHPPGPTAPVQPGAPRRLGRRVTDACTCRALSWLSLTAYCFSSSPFSYGGSILYPQKNVKTVIFIEKRGADDHSPFVFDLFYITACWSGSRCPASPRWR